MMALRPQTLPFYHLQEHAHGFSSCRHCLDNSDLSEEVSPQGVEQISWSSPEAHRPPEWLLPLTSHCTYKSVLQNLTLPSTAFPSSLFPFSSEEKILQRQPWKHKAASFSLETNKAKDQNSDSAEPQRARIPFAGPFIREQNDLH